MVSKILTFITLLTLPVTVSFAQTSSNTFEVASIKPSDPNTRGVAFRNAPGGLNISGATLKLLIQEAYDIREFQISGGPGWIDSDRYDIVAKTERAASPPALPNTAEESKARELQRERLRALLADRFQLKVRRDKKEMPIFALEQAKGGPKLKASKPFNPAEESKTSPEQRSGSFIRVGRGQIIGTSMTLDILARVLSQQLGRTVIDKTGLSGSYDFTLEWTPDPGQGFGPGVGGPIEMPRPDNPAPSVANGPSVFAAIQEQLGLKLDSQKAPVDVLVIESVEKPSEN